MNFIEKVGERNVGFYFYKFFILNTNKAFEVSIDKTRNSQGHSEIGKMLEPGEGGGGEVREKFANISSACAESLC